MAAVPIQIKNTSGQEGVQLAGEPILSSTTSPLAYFAADNYLMASGALQGLLDDYVIEESTGTAVNTWYYRKWASGFAECWKKYEGGSKKPSAGWFLDGLALGTFPFTFKARPCASAVAYGPYWARPHCFASLSTTNAGEWQCTRISGSTTAQKAQFWVYYWGYI